MVKLDVQLFVEDAFENGGDCISSARAFVVAIWAMIISLTGKCGKLITKDGVRCMRFWIILEFQADSLFVSYTKCAAYSETILEMELDLSLNQQLTCNFSNQRFSFKLWLLER